MRTYAIIPLILILVSCSPSIKDDFRKTIIAYQKEFPIPADADKNDTNRIYLYHAYFSLYGKDTLFAVHRTYSIIENGRYEGRNIYQDKEMKPLEIYDLYNISGAMTEESAKNQDYSLWYSGAGEDVQFTTLYWYKVKNNKIHFLKKDTTFVDRMNKLNEGLHLK